MNEWNIWFTTGIEHILDLNGYDHMFFVALLTMAFPLNEWKMLAGLITAFTIGHSITLVLSAVDVLYVKQAYIEILIMLTIVSTAALELFQTKNTVIRGKVIYIIIICFGWIHGMGFSFLLKSMLGHTESIVVPLLMFNLGLEVGQLTFVLFMILLLFLIQKCVASSELIIRKVIVTVIFSVSVILCFIRILNIFQ